MPIVVFTIVVPLDAISMMVVVFIGSHGHRRDQGHAQKKCTQVTIHSSSQVLLANKPPVTKPSCPESHEQSGKSAAHFFSGKTLSFLSPRMFCRVRLPGFLYS